MSFEAWEISKNNTFLKTNERLDLYSINLKNKDLSGALLQGANLTKANLQNVILKNANLEGAILNEANLENSILESANCFKANFECAKLKSSNCSNANFQKVKFQGANLYKANFSGANLIEAEFDAKVELKESLNQENIVVAIQLKFFIEQIGLSRENIKKSGFGEDYFKILGLQILKGAYAERTNFSGANMEKAKFREASLVSAIFHDAILTEANFNRCYLKNADFKNAKAEKAIFNDAILTGANFQNTDFHHSYFQNAYLDEVVISESNFERANLEKAYLYKITYDENFRCQLIWLKYLLPRRKGHKLYKSIRLDGAYGNPLFVRFAKDCAYISTFEDRYNKLISGTYRWTCDYGRSMLIVAFWASIVSVLFGIIYNLIEFFIPCSFTLNNEIINKKFAFFYYSVITFTTLGFGDITANNWISMSFAIAEVIIGYCTLGLLISILARVIVNRAD